MFMPRKLLISLAATCAMAGSLAARTDTPSRADNHFVMNAAEGGRAEVEMGRLATQHASSDQVKLFGQRMIDDHSKANHDLMNIASREGFTLPNKIDRKDQKEINHLAKLNGPAFDKAYMKYMVKDHKKDVSTFQHEADHGRNPAVKDFASQTAPVLQQHLQQAEQTKTQVSK